MKIYIVVYDYEDDPSDRFEVVAFESKQLAENICTNLNKQFEKLPARYHVQELDYIVDINQHIPNITWDDPFTTVTSYSNTTGE